LAALSGLPLAAHSLVFFVSAIRHSALLASRLVSAVSLRLVMASP
jgi:hypothetical protein